MPRTDNWSDRVEDPDDIGKRCLFCGEPFVAQRSTRRYCSVNCRVQSHRWPVSKVDELAATKRTCKACGRPIDWEARSDKQFCSARCRQRWHRLPLTPDEQVILLAAMIDEEAGRVPTPSKTLDAIIDKLQAATLTRLSDVRSSERYGEGGNRYSGLSTD